MIKKFSNVARYRKLAQINSLIITNKNIQKKNKNKKTNIQRS